MHKGYRMASDTVGNRMTAESSEEEEIKGIEYWLKPMLLLCTRI